MNLLFYISDGNDQKVCKDKTGSIAAHIKKNIIDGTISAGNEVLNGFIYCRYGSPVQKWNSDFLFCQRGDVGGSQGEECKNEVFCKMCEFADVMVKQIEIYFKTCFVYECQ